MRKQSSLEKTRNSSKIQRRIGFGRRKFFKLEIGAISVFCILISLMTIVGSISGQLQVNVTVNSANTIGTNKLSLGFGLTTDWTYWRNRPIMDQLVKDANFKMVRLFSSLVEPCTYWNEATKTGTFNWAKADSLFQRIFGFGAEPIVTLGFCDYNGLQLPPGMAVDSVTGWPRPDSFAAYCAEWVKHCRTAGFPVRFYEIINEAWYKFYPNWNWNDVKAGYFLQLFNACYNAMHSANSKVLVGNDASLYRKFLDYWIAHGGRLDFLSFHKYDCDGISMDSQTPLLRAETRCFVTDSYFYGVNDARKLWFNSRGTALPAVDSETNWAATTKGGTDPRIQQLVGAVWTGLLTRASVLNGLDYYCYFTFSSGKSWEIANKPSGGYGMGMINLDDNKPWYPYYVQEMIGSNLAVGDQIVESSSTSSDVRSLSWIHKENLNTLIISKNTQSIDLKLYGLQGILNYSRIDNAVSWQNPRVQIGSISATATLTLNGYTVILLQSLISASPSLVFEDGFASGNFNAWSGTSTVPDEAASVSSALPHQGAYSARFATNGNTGYEAAYCYETISSQSELYATGYFYASQSGIASENDRFYLVKLRSNNSDVAYAGWRIVGGVTKWTLMIRDGTGYATAYSSSSPAPNRWYSVQLHWVQNSAIGKGELYVNNVLICSITGRNTAALGSVILVRFGLAEVVNCGSTAVYCDDCRISRTK